MLVARRFLLAETGPVARRAMSTLWKNDAPRVFPNETEGNIYADNHSINVDGVTPRGLAFRNARVALLQQHLSSKVANNVADVTLPASGSGPILEAGDSISIGSFQEQWSHATQHLSGPKKVLFVEDASVGSFRANNVNVRVITDDAAVAVAARNLLIQIPARPAQHFARFDGWNLEAPHNEPVPVWNGSAYDFPIPAEAAKGERPIVVVATRTGPFEKADRHVAVSFMQKAGGIVGANVLLTGKFSQLDLVNAISEAACGMINESQTHLCVPSAAMVKGSDSTLIVGADEEFTVAAAASGHLYGAFQNTVRAEGVSAMFGGAFAPKGTKADAVSVSNGNLVTIPLPPNNLAMPVKHLIFFEKGRETAAKISADECIQRMTALMDAQKAEVFSNIMKPHVKSMSVAGTVKAAGF